VLATQPAYQTVVLKEGPPIGWERWRELDTDYYAHLVRAFIQMLAPTGVGDYASAMLAATMRGTLTELSFEIAQSSDQTLARQEALVVIGRLLSSFHAAPPNSPTPELIRIGIGQLRAGASAHLDRVAAGETIDVHGRSHPTTTDGQHRRSRWRNPHRELP
jgi:hypothetical protein